MKRIQRKRTKDWRKPPNSQYVGRGTRWGNPFWLEGDMVMCDASHRRKILSPIVIYDNNKLYSKTKGNKEVIRLYELWIHGKILNNIVKSCPFTIDDIKKELAGKNLMYYCPLDIDCHADILLKIANQ